MFCSECSKENSNDTKFCSNCGHPMEGIEKTRENHHVESSESSSMTFSKSISTCLSKFFDFNGRASRPEYWWFYLFTVLISWGSILIDSTQLVSLIINLVFLFPVMAAGARRLHDINRSGWWQLLIITIIGIIPLVIWWASKGEEQENRYGKSVYEK